MNIQLVSAGIVIKDGKVLITQRFDDAKDYPGLWEFPGGKVEPHELPEEALIRECKEECDIDVSVDHAFDVGCLFGESKKLVVLFYVCAWNAGEVKRLGHQKHAWVHKADLHLYPMPPLDVPVIKRLQQRELLVGLH